jgi:hypothetical protein
MIEQLAEIGILWLGLSCLGGGWLAVAVLTCEE